MKKMIFIILIILIFGLNFVSADGGRIELFLDHPQQIELNKDFSINFEVFNNSNDRLWDATVTIEKEFMDKYAKYIKSNRNYSTSPFKFVVIGPGYKMSDTFNLALSEEFPEEEVTFNIVVEGEKGACRCEGTTIYLKQAVTLKTFFKKTEANLMVENKYFEVYGGDALDVPVMVYNSGDILIRNILIEIKGNGLPDNIAELQYIQPGKDLSEIISVPIDTKLNGNLIDGTVIIKYKDQNGKIITSQEPITIKVIEKPINTNEEIINPINVEENKVDTKINTKYLVIIIPIASILFLILSYLVIIKR